MRCRLSSTTLLRLHRTHLTVDVSTPPPPYSHPPRPSFLFLPLLRRFLSRDNCSRTKTWPKRPDVCKIEAFLNATQFSVDMQGEEHCCCTNMTQAEVDASDRENSGATGTVSPAPLGASISPDSGTAYPTPAQQGNDSAAGTLEAKNRSDEGVSAVAGSGGSNGGARSSVLGVALACFVIGAIFGGIPAVMYFRRFRYEAMRGGGYDSSRSYEMS